MSVQPGRLRVVVPEVPDEGLEALIDAPSPGGYLREQRKRRGMSVEQLAAATKIPRESIAALEDDRYDALPGAVFVKGFLRCCARALAVDPQRVMELLYERERAALQARRRNQSDLHPVASSAEISPPTPRLEEPVTSRGRPPRASALTTPLVEHPLLRIAARLPSATTVLWIVVGILIAMVVLAAFNLMGSVPPAGNQS